MSLSPTDYKKNHPLIIEYALRLAKDWANIKMAIDEAAKNYAIETVENSKLLENFTI